MFWLFNTCIFLVRNIVYFLLLHADIKTEKTHQSIFQGVTGYDKNALNHTETNEKNTLPAKEGSFISFYKNGINCKTS